MALTDNRDDPGIEYRRHFWGEVILGSRQDLQALGIAVGGAFPGEPGGPRRQLRCLDPRGLPCRITNDSTADRYQVLIDYHPDLKRPEYGHDQKIEFAPGVIRYPSIWADVYTGTPEAMVAAGLVRPEHLPGAPGMRKQFVRLRPDGSVDMSCSASWRTERGQAVEKQSATRINLYIYVSEAEAYARRDSSDEHERAWRDRLEALPKPAPLVPPQRQQAAKKRRAQMRLVWSRPAPSFTLHA